MDDPLPPAVTLGGADLGHDQGLDLLGGVDPSVADVCDVLIGHPAVVGRAPPDGSGRAGRVNAGRVVQPLVVAGVGPAGRGGVDGADDEGPVSVPAAGVDDRAVDEEEGVGVGELGHFVFLAFC